MPVTITDQLHRDLVGFLTDGRSSQGRRLLGRLVTEAEGQQATTSPKRYPAIEINGEWFLYTSAEYESLHHAQSVHFIVPADRTDEMAKVCAVNANLSSITIKPSKTAGSYHYYGAKVIGLDVQRGLKESIMVMRFDADQPFRATSNG